MWGKIELGPKVLFTTTKSMQMNKTVSVKACLYVYRSPLLPFSSISQHKRPFAQLQGLQ